MKHLHIARQTEIKDYVDTERQKETFHNEEAPMASIVRSLRATKVQEIRAEGSNEEFKMLAEIGFVPMVARDEWKRNHTIVNLSKLVTIADEAFALVTMENNINEWMKEAVLGKDAVKRGEHTRYTSQGRNKDGTKKGWTLEGKKRYNELFDSVVAARQGTATQERETWLRNEWRKEEIEGGRGGVNQSGNTNENVERRMEEEQFVPRNGFAF